ncbi:MAG: DUF4432 family protein [Bacteroidales bacterium]
MKRVTNPQIFNVKDLNLNETNELFINGFKLCIFHHKDDPHSANRVGISNKNIQIEFFPSKGLSVAQAWMKGRAIFWDAPAGLADTEELDLWSDEILINGQAAPGFTFLKTLVGGLEFYGLRNWGMPVTVDGKAELLHGETSNIPVNEILFGTENDQACWIQGSFLYRSFEGNPQSPWYERGSAIFKVTRKFTIPANSLEIVVEDCIENVSESVQIPDWGYHITLRPEEGARLLVPSRHVEERGGNALPSDIETWHRAVDSSIRTETGIVHKDLLHSQSESGNDCIVSLLEYPDRTGLAVSVPPSPYFQTWFCNGGKGSKEFTDRKGNSILMKNWDGMGLEIGSSALDHNGNIDKTVSYEPALNPGDSITIPFRIKWLDAKHTENLAMVINDFKIR